MNEVQQLVNVLAGFFLLFVSTEIVFCYLLFWLVSLWLVCISSDFLEIPICSFAEKKLKSSLIVVLYLTCRQALCTFILLSHLIPCPVFGLLILKRQTWTAGHQKPAQPPVRIR